MKATPSQRAAKAISPLAAWASRTAGSKAAIIETLNRIAPNDNGRKWNRQQVESYLHADPAKRHEPKLGAGLALIEAANLVMDKIVSKQIRNGDPEHKGI